MSDPLPPAEQWARFRFSIIGALLACPPEAGQLRHRLGQLAGQSCGATRWTVRRCA